MVRTFLQKLELSEQVMGLVHVIRAVFTLYATNILGLTRARKQADLPVLFRL